MPVCTSSNTSSSPCSSQSWRSALRNCGRHDAHAALALDRLDQDGGGLRPDRALDRLEVAERHLVEAVHDRAEAVEMFLLSAGRERRQRAAVERALEGDDAVALGLAVRRLILARHLDDAFHRLGAGIGEEHVVGEARGAQPLGQPLAFRDAIEVGDVPELLRLLGERLDQMRMRVAERIDRDAGGEIEIAVAVGRDQPDALAPLEGEVDTRIGRQQDATSRPLIRQSEQICRNEMCRLVRAARSRVILFPGGSRCQHEPRMRGPMPSDCEPRCTVAQNLLRIAAD